MIVSKPLFLRLFDIAFKSRTSLPLLLSAGFMLLDFHLRLDVEVEARVIEQPANDNDNDDEEEEEEEEMMDAIGWN